MSPRRRALAPAPTAGHRLKGQEHASVSTTPPKLMRRRSTLLQPMTERYTKAKKAAKIRTIKMMQQSTLNSADMSYCRTSTEEVDLS